MTPADSAGVERDLQPSFFPEIAPARPVGYLPASVFTGTNAALIASVAPLYFSGSVLDTTYGEGKWWTIHRPADLRTHDLDPAKGDGVSFLDLPEPDDSVDTASFDPPYVPAGGVRNTGATADEISFRGRFGLEPRTREELLALFYGGMAECCRVSRHYVVAKANDYVDWTVFHLGHLDMIEAARRCGWGVHDLIVHHTGSGPGGHNIMTTRRARRHHSYLIVFAPGLNRPWPESDAIATAVALACDTADRTPGEQAQLVQLARLVDDPDRQLERTVVDTWRPA